MRQKLLTLCLSSALLAGSAIAASAQAPPNQAPEAAERRHADDRRHRLERFRRLFRRRRGARPSDPEHRPHRQGRRSLHELVRPGELHGRPRLVHHRAHPDPLGALDRGRPGDQNALRKETPTIAEFFKKNGYSTYFSGKWHLGDKPESYPIEHGFDEMKAFAAYYPGVYTYSDTSSGSIRGFPRTTRNSRRPIRRREHVRMGGRRGPAGDQGRDDQL